MSDTPLHIPELGDKFVDYRDPIWGNSYTWSWERKTTDIVYAVVHHSVTIHEATPDDIALLHKARGWGGIGYHFVITKDGKVYYVGDVGTARASVANMNEKVIGICMVGDFTKHLPSDEQIVSCHKLCKFFIDQPQWLNIKSWKDVVGHKQLDSTACPGTSWDKALPDNMWCRVRDGRPYTPAPEPNGSTEAGQDTTIITYKKFVADLVEVTKPPSDKRELPELLGWIETLRMEAAKVPTIQTNYGSFVKWVGQQVECAEESEEAIKKALEGFVDKKNNEIAEVKKKRLAEFTISDHISAIIYKVTGMRG